METQTNFSLSRCNRCGHFFGKQRDLDNHKLEEHLSDYFSDLDESDSDSKETDHESEEIDSEEIDPDSGKISPDSEEIEPHSKEIGPDFEVVDLDSEVNDTDFKEINSGFERKDPEFEKNDPDIVKNEPNFLKNDPNLEIINPNLEKNPTFRTNHSSIKKCFVKIEDIVSPKFKDELKIRFPDEYLQGQLSFARMFKEYKTPCQCYFCKMRQLKKEKELK